MVENRDHVRLHQVHVRLRLYFARAPSTISSQESVLTAVDLDAFGATMNHAEVLAPSCVRQADRPVSVCRRMEMWAGQNDLRSVLTYWDAFSSILEPQFEASMQQVGHRLTADRRESRNDESSASGRPLRVRRTCADFGRKTCLF